MQTLKKFNAVDVELLKRNLIEASAGTGKTFSIALLFLRFILNGYDIKEILVVTFTNAATEEVRDRIRRFLKDALTRLKAAPESYQENGDPITLILQNETENFTKIELAMQRLENGLLEFDEAAVFTIHGFCQRVITENSFECGAVFNAELAGDSSQMTEQIARDFWREYFYDEDSAFLDYAIGKKKFSPEYFIKLGGKYIGQPDLIFDEGSSVSEDGAEIGSLIEEFNNAAKKTQLEWLNHKDNLKKEILDNKNMLNQRSYNASKEKKLNSYLANPTYEMGKEAAFFTETAVNEQIKQDLPDLPRFFSMMEQLKTRGEEIIASFDQKVLHYKRLFFSYATEKMEELKRKSGTLSFDDLLLTVYKAIKSENGERLKKTLQQKYKAVLIDEFQDTDPVQYEIFSKLFDAKDNVMFFIGDPKQAIYSFRGADIYTYLFAAAGIDQDRKYTMKKNYRSASELVKGVNEIFSSRDNPFVNNEIGMEKVSSINDDKEDETVLTIGGKKAEPLAVIYKKEDENFNKGMLNKDRAQKVFVEATVVEISRLLDKGSKCKIGERFVKPADIAILTRSGSQALSIKASLTRAGIPAVLCNADNVFTSGEAKDFYYFLKAVENPGNVKYVKASLLTDLAGHNSNYLKSLDHNEQLYDKILTSFRTWADLAAKRGFLYMFSEWMRKEDIRKKLLGQENGERKLTNLLHLSEILNKTVLEKNLSLSSLVTYFAEKIGGKNTGQGEEEMLRLESDENAVQIVTIHKSKGLEYAIVFCPFLYGQSQVNKPKVNGKEVNVFTYHNDEKKSVINLSETDDVEHAAKEQNSQQSALGENIRLFYVALTRAKYRCYIQWAKVSGAGTSAPAYLFHGITTDDQLKNGTDDQLYGELESLARKHPFISVAEVEANEIKHYTAEAQAKTASEVKKFSAAITKSWAVASFSSLAAETSVETMIDELQKNQKEDDTASAIETEEVDGSEKNIFSFPRGAKAGEALHAIFEEITFTEENHLKKISQILQTYHYVKTSEDEAWCNVIEQMTENVLKAQLPDQFSLSEIKNSSRMTELEFYFPLKKIRREEIKKILGEDQKHIKVEEIEGYIHGFIDLIVEKEGKFYITDWKSNYLGDSALDYNRERMTIAMTEHNYHLQYLFYAVALDTYLQKKIRNYDYDRHFGGVYYIFLRGVVDNGNKAGNGIYHIEASEIKDKVQQLSRLMIGKR